MVMSLLPTRIHQQLPDPTDTFMRSWHQFDECLSSPSDPQLWAEHLVFEAGKLLSSFDADDWTAAQERWKERDVTWQARFADVLLDGDLVRTAPILVKMIEETPHDSVAMAAADSLRTALKTRMLAVSPKVITRIRHLQSKSSGLMRDSLMRLIERLHNDTAS